MKRGEIYLVNFGKVRPALIIQNDIANRNIEKVDFQGVTVIPLSTNLFGGDVRVQIVKRDNLENTCEICINELCTLDLRRIVLENRLTILSDEEMQEVEFKLMRHLAL